MTKNWYTPNCLVSFIFLFASLFAVCLFQNKQQSYSEIVQTKWLDLMLLAKPSLHFGKAFWKRILTWVTSKQSWVCRLPVILWYALKEKFTLVCGNQYNWWLETSWHGISLFESTLIQSRLTPHYNDPRNAHKHWLSNSSKTQQKASEGGAWKSSA